MDIIFHYYWSYITLPCLTIKFKSPKQYFTWAALFKSSHRSAHLPQGKGRFQLPVGAWHWHCQAEAFLPPNSPSPTILSPNEEKPQDFCLSIAVAVLQKPLFACYCGDSSSSHAPDSDKHSVSQMTQKCYQFKFTWLPLTWSWLICTCQELKTTS